METADVLFEILKASIHEECLAEAIYTDQQWADVVNLSIRQGVAAVAFETIQKLPSQMRPPKSIYLKCALHTDIVECAYKTKSKVVSDLLRLFDENGIRTMMLKGFGVSCYYPQPNHRPFSDIDIFQFGEIERADEIVAKEFGVKISGEIRHHTKYVYRNTLIENHYDFLTTHLHYSNYLFEQILKKEVLHEFQATTIGGYIAYVPSATFNALFLMRHMAGHYAVDGISLRHLLDWGLFVKAEYDNVDWARVNEIFEQYNMKPFVDAINGIINQYLGLNISTIPLVDRNRGLEQRILNDIIYPRYTKCKYEGGIKYLWWKTRRLWHNRWKHKIIYRESWLTTLVLSFYYHISSRKSDI